ncbi:MAG: low molecular weight protein arginine phosphatase [Opitutales bacterium]|nr:low molecular weight protein arginine phosphatase [Opitutales bacterium]
MSEIRPQITVVCTGNTCRSPMAERLLQHALAAEPEPLRSIRVVSAGVAAFPGDSATENAVRALKKVDIDLKDHRSRRFSYQLLDESSLVLAMTDSHRAFIRHEFPEDETPVYLFREFMQDGNPEVPDPCGGPLDYYIETRDNLAEAIPSLLAELRKYFSKS